MPTTSCPSASSRSHRWEPMNPAAPLTTTRMQQTYLVDHVNRFESWLATTDYGVTIRSFPAGTRTATDAARAVGCELGQIVKSLVFTAAGGPVVVLVSGSNRLDEHRLAAV